jgi:hypothetical protein
MAALARSLQPANTINNPHDADTEKMREHRAEVAQIDPERARIMEIRDHAQEIAVREAIEVVRWEQVEVAALAVTTAAQRYIAGVLPVPRSSGQNASDRAGAFDQVQDLLLNTIAGIRWANAQTVGREQLREVVLDLLSTYGGERAEIAHKICNGVALTSAEIEGLKQVAVEHALDRGKA